MHYNGNISEMVHLGRRTTIFLHFLGQIANSMYSSVRKHVHKQISFAVQARTAYLFVAFSSIKIQMNVYNYSMGFCNTTT